MDVETLKADPRETKGSAVARRLRRQGKVPAVLYGHRQGVLVLSLSVEPLKEFLDAGHHLVTLDLGGRQERALVKEVQFDAWGQEILHVDFSRVALDETVTVPVGIVGHGTPKATLSGAVLEQPLHTLEVECKADHIPDQIVIEVGDMEMGQMFHVRDLQLPDGVTAAVEPDAIVFVLQEPRGEEEQEAPAPEAGAEEPEVIGRVTQEEGEEQEPEKT